ncbi:MAG TPA: asparagine synthase (glutamine-hydrolyzing) [Thermodesulfobacteriota bacterium]|nr:asparagine synthase (glutamine-hydrolyzing) [Thermodesulfobacteriota bacterium]
MCGICGVVYSHPERPVDREMLRQMTEIMAHRGPDSQGFHIAPGVGLGIRRLSIIDLEAGDQPIFNEDGSIIVVCNGEIYNFKELRQELLARGHRFKTHSDIEVIVHLYEDHGEECVSYLRGMFGFALWDRNRRQLMLARDRLGIKPLFYSTNMEGIYFGSEIKSILMSGGIEREMDVKALKDLFNLGFVLSPKTLFTRIRRLLPGHYLLYRDGKSSIRQYWDVRFPTRGEDTPRRSQQEWAELLRYKLEESVRIHLRSDVPVGAWLSSGIDSSSIASLMSLNSDRPIETFSLAFENQRFDEISQQKTLNHFKFYNLDNRQALCTAKDFEILPKAVWHCEDPFTTGVEIPQMILSQLASNSVKVVLTGEGSDEIFGGYPWFITHKLLQPFTKLPRGMQRFLARMPAVRRRWPRASRILSAPSEMNLARYKFVIDSGIAEFDDQIFSDDLRYKLSDQSSAEDSLSLPREFNSWHTFAQLQYLELKVRLPDYITRHLDAASMAYSLEARVPFLDHELVEFSTQIPPSLKMRGVQEKHILRQAMRDVLPREIAQRKKRGLSAPYAQWVDELPAFASELMSENCLREKGYFNPEFMTQLAGQHGLRKTVHSKYLMGVLGIQLWDDLFMKGCKPRNQ